MSSVTPPNGESAPPPASPPPVSTSVEQPERSRLHAAKALDVLRRTVRFGLREAGGPRPRYLRATCGPWLAQISEDQLEPVEREALDELRRALDDADQAARASVELLQRLDRGLEAFEGLFGSLDAVSFEPMVQLLPSGERERAVQARQRQAELEERRKARQELPPVELPESDEAPAEPQAPRDTPDSSAEPAVTSDEEPAPSANDGDAEPRRERRRRKRETRETRDDEAQHKTEPEAAPEPKPARTVLRPLDDPEGAGQALTDFFPRLPRPLAKALHKQGITTVAELLLQPPVDYELLPRAVEPSESLPTGEMQVLRGTVVRRLTRLSPLGRRHEVILGDEQAQVVCRWVTPRDETFWASMTIGARVALHGTVELDGEAALLHEAELVWIDSRGQGRQARYGLEGVSDAQMRGLLRRAIDAFADTLQDPLPEGDRKRLRLLGLGEALRRLHFPTHGARRGRERMAFDELLLYQLGHSLGGRQRPQERGSAHTILHRLVSQIMSTRSQPLSDGQEIAFSEIRRDLARPRPMNRLLQGDVGVGKGFVALLAAVVVAEGREQVVFIAPDAIAAEHRFLFAEPVLRSVGLMPALLLDKPDAAQTDALKRGEVHVVFTTPAISKAWPGFRRLGLVVVEEREEYGTVSSRNLPAQGVRPDLLVLTDAPIPTSIALTVFGDMDLSLVPGQHITGLQVTSHPWAEHMEVYAKARVELEAGRQIYVVLPMIGGQERLNQRELARFADALRGDAFPGARIGVFSKVQSREERHRTYEDFLHRRIDVLLTTTIIEDGPAVPNATTTVVLEADRFDLVRLHRLRAHVARGVRPGRCMFVLSEQPDPEGVRRVELMVGENDAFRIAELDLASRGAEALLGERAKELPQFRYMDPVEDRDLLVRARAEAFDILVSSPGLTKGPHSHLRAALEQSWKRWFPGKPVLGAKPSSGRRTGRRRRRRSR
jgi:ATP-dependent DNA helicase RecG